MNVNIKINIVLIVSMKCLFRDKCTVVINEDVGRTGPLLQTVRGRPGQKKQITTRKTKMAVLGPLSATFRHSETVIGSLR
jgi:hypothetical protein